MLSPASPGLKVMKLGRAPTSEEMHFFSQFFAETNKTYFYHFYNILSYASLVAKVFHGDKLSLFVCREPP